LVRICRDRHRGLHVLVIGTGGIHLVSAVVRVGDFVTDERV
jgi:hypothetical protein